MKIKRETTRKNYDLPLFLLKPLPRQIALMKRRESESGRRESGIAYASITYQATGSVAR